MRKLETASFPTQNASLRPPTAGTRVSRHVRLQVNGGGGARRADVVQREHFGGELVLDEAAAVIQLRVVDAGAVRLRLRHLEIDLQPARPITAVPAIILRLLSIAGGPRGVRTLPVSASLILKARNSTSYTFSVSGHRNPAAHSTHSRPRVLSAAVWTLALAIIAELQPLPHLRSARCTAAPPPVSPRSCWELPATFARHPRARNLRNQAPYRPSTSIDQPCDQPCSRSRFSARPSLEAR